jgi:hypothetical protein
MEVREVKETYLNGGAEVQRSRRFFIINVLPGLVTSVPPFLTFLHNLPDLFSLNSPSLWNLHKLKFQNQGREQTNGTMKAAK